MARLWYTVVQCRKSLPLCHILVISISAGNTLYNMQSLDSNGANDWQLCACGRTFAQPSASNNHKCTCPKTRKRLSSALDGAKERWTGNKRRKVNLQVHEPSEASELVNQPGLMGAPSPSTHQDSVSTIESIYFNNHNY